MALAYRPPGVSVDEIVNPTFTPFLGDPTSICIIGPALGYESVTDFVQLLDNEPATLSIDDGINVTGLTVQSSDGSVTYVQGTATGGVGAATGRPSGDYYVVGNQVFRSMTTNIQDDETVVVYYEFGPTSHGTQHRYQEEVTLDQLTPFNLSNTSTNTGDAVIQVIDVQHKGIVSPTAYSLNLSVNPATLTIASGGSFPTHPFSSSSYQQLWVDYTDVNGNQQINLPIALVAGVANFNNPQPNSNPAVANVVVRNTADTTVTDTVFRFGSTSTSSGLASNDNSADFVVLASGSSVITFSIQRADIVPSNIPSGASVQVGYTATPSDYYVPTQVFSQSDVEDKYGAALDANGNILSPVTLAAGFAFANGATDMVIQALFSLGDDGFRTQGGVDTSGQSDANNLDDWEDTLVALRDVQDVNVLVPLVSTGTGNYSDVLSLNVFIAIQEHIQFMITNNDTYLVAICGEDSTATGPSGTALAAPTTLQSHALTLNNTSLPEVMTLISPASYQYAASTGTATNIGGQYVASMVAGRLASQDVQQTLTRRTLIGLTAVNTLRAESDKDTDAASGLFVIENYRGTIRIRHAITVAVNNPNTRELSVIRAKGYMIENVKDVVDQQIIGQIIADDNAAFTIQTLVEAELQSLITEGAIVDYQNVQSRLLTSDPTTCEIRYSYLPAFPLNYVNIIFSINTASGVVTTSSVANAGL